MSRAVARALIGGGGGCGVYIHIFVYIYAIDLKIDNLDRVSIPTKIVATFVEHPIHGTTYDSK